MAKCKHERGVDNLGYCRMCGDLVNKSDKVKTQKEYKKQLVEIASMLSSPLIDKKTEIYLREKQLKLSELAFK